MSRLLRITEKTALIMDIYQAALKIKDPQGSKKALTLLENMFSWNGYSRSLESVRFLSESLKQKPQILFRSKRKTMP